MSRSTEDFEDVFLALSDFADQLDGRGGKSDKRTRRELRRLNRNLEDLLDAVEDNGGSGRVEAFLEEYDKLEKEFEEGGAFGRWKLSTRRKKKEADNAARAVRINREVREEDIEALDNLQESM